MGTIYEAYASYGEASDAASMAKARHGLVSKGVRAFKIKRRSAKVENGAVA